MGQQKGATTLRVTSSGSVKYNESGGEDVVAYEHPHAREETLKQLRHGRVSCLREYLPLKDFGAR